MRRTFILLAAALFALQALAASAVRFDRGDAAGRVAGAPWVQRARVTAASLQTALAESHRSELAGNRPIVLIETNYYTFLPGEALQVRITTNANGYSGPVTMYLYRENRTSGERRYYSIAGGGLQPAGTISDLFGTPGSPIPVGVPDLDDFVLFGSSDTSALSWGVAGAIGGSIAVPSGETGLYQWVLELRDAAGKRVISRSNAMYSYVQSSINVSGTIAASQTWTANNRYVLSGFVGVAEPAVLTIEPGTVIYGGDSRATLFIRRGAQIVAAGTARRPIVFTSPQRVGSRAQRDWGSLVLLGRAPINEPAGGQRGYLEGLPATAEYAFGGTNPADSSGVLRYVRLEFGGFEIEANQEINGLTLAGVGSGTVVDYVEVLHNKDDAFEFFGGTVNAKHLLGVAFADDGLDMDLGYTGDIQFAAMIKRAANDEGDGNVLTESDGHPNNFTLTPLTNPRIYNVTGVRVGGEFGNYGGVLRRGSAGKFYNGIITGSRRAPLTFRDDATFNNIATGELVFDHSLFGGSFADSAFTSSDRAAQTRAFVLETMKRNRNEDPLLAIGTPTLVKTFAPDLSPLASSPALDADYVALPPDNGFFEQVDYIGAVGPGENWLLTGWANFSDN